MIRVVDSLNLSAPGAAKFENPLALSYRSLSDAEAVTNSSFTNKPTLYDGELLYWSRITVESATVTKNPLIKYTPWAIFAAAPVDVELDMIVVAKLAPDLILERE